MKQFIIIGTNTDVGKTIVTAGLAVYFQQKNIKFDIQKWISTGDKAGISQDLLFVIKSFNANSQDNIFISGKSKNEIKKIDLQNKNIYSFKFAGSPHLAAQLENKQINPQMILDSLHKFSKDNQYLIIEGVGGLLVPLTKQVLLLDIIKQAKLPVVIVTLNTLGTINSTLLTISTLRSYKINILGVIFNNYIKENSLIKKDNINTIKQFSDVKILGEINKIKTKADLIKQFKSIGDNLIKGF